MESHPPDGLRELRLAAGLSQEKLAHQAQCSSSSVKLLENGFRPKNSDVLRRIVAVLNDDAPPAEGASNNREGHDHHARIER